MQSADKLWSWRGLKAREGRGRPLICGGGPVLGLLPVRECRDEQGLVSPPHPLPSVPSLISDGKNWLSVCSQNDPCTCSALGFTSPWCCVDLAFQTSLLASVSDDGCSSKQWSERRLLHFAPAWVRSNRLLYRKGIYNSSFLFCAL